MAKHEISQDDAEQFLDALNDWLANGDRHIRAISEEKASHMNRYELNGFLFDLMEAALKLRGQ